MTLLLFRRFFRSFRDNALQFAALLLLVAAVVMVITVLESTAYTITKGRTANADTECIEDGQFSTMYPLTEEQLRSLTDLYGVTLQEQFSVDISVGETVYRAFAPRKSIDRPVLSAGTVPSDDRSVVLEQNYARIHGIVCGDTLIIGDTVYTVCGTGSLPDYVHSTLHASDMAVTSDVFAWILVTDSEFDRLFSDPANKTEFTYSYRLGIDTDLTGFSRAVYNTPAEELTALLEADPELRSDQEFSGLQLSNVQSFTERQDNHRMDVEIDYAVLYRTAGWIVGVMLIGMLAFIFAVVTRNQVHNEHVMIGSLYALGVSRGTLVSLYITPHVMISLLGGILGLIVGYLPDVAALSMNAFHAEISFPYYETARPLVIYLYALVMPPLVNLLVNCCVLNRTFSCPALALLRGTYSRRRILNIPLHSRSFIRAFQLRRLIEERGSLIVFFSVLVSVTLLLLGMTTQAMVDNNERAAREEILYQYLCVLKNPLENPETVGEKLIVRSMKTEYREQNVDFSLVGLPENSRFFDIQPQKSTDTAVANEAIASKLGLKAGDCITFREGVAENTYTLKITEIVPSGANLELYIDIDSLREILALPGSYANVIVSEDPPDVDPSLLYSVTETEDIIRGISSMRRATANFIRLSYSSAVIIFIVALYLTVSTMIDRVASGISLLQVFGFHPGEIQRMYVNSIIYSVVSALLLAIPIAKLLCDRISPYVYAYLTVGMFFKIPFRYYVLIFGAAIILFFLILFALMGKVRRIPMSTVLKSRE